MEYNWELYHGGWIAPNIYFLGNSGIVKFGDLTIAGLSGIYNPNHYQTGTSKYSGRTAVGIALGMESSYYHGFDMPCLYTDSALLHRLL